MTGRELLNSLIDIDKDVRKKIDMLDTLRAIAIGITAKTDKESIQTSGDKDKIGSIVAKIADLEREIYFKTDDYLKKRDIAKKIILSIENEKYQNILYDYYICRRKLYEIAEVYEIKYEDCKKEKYKAIKVFEKLYNTR